MGKKEVRATFRRAVFGRDHYCCVMCHRPGKDRQDEKAHEKYHKKPEVVLDAHHVTDRHNFKNGGYVKENGITVCEDCHLKAEQFHITKGEECIEGFHPNDLYLVIKSTLEQAIRADAKNIL